MRTTIVGDVELAAALDSVQYLQVVLLAKLTILVLRQHAFTGPAVRCIEDTTGSLFQAGDGIGGKRFGDDTQGRMHGTPILANRL